MTLAPSTVALPATYSKPSGSITTTRVLPAATPFTCTTASCDARPSSLASGSQRGIEFELHVALGRGLLAQHEVAAPQRAGLQLGELRIVAAGVTHAIGAGRELQVVGQRQLVELHGVRAGIEVFEVEVAVLVGDAVAAVLEIDAHVGTPASSRPSSSHLPSNTRPTMKPFCENSSSFMRTSARASFERTLPGAKACAVLIGVLHAAHRDGEFEHVAQRDGLARLRGAAAGR